MGKGGMKGMYDYYDDSYSKGKGKGKGLCNWFYNNDGDDSYYSKGKGMMRLT